MKSAPSVRTPRLFTSDYVEARKALGREPGMPIGVVLSQAGYREMVAYGCRFPCAVAVDPNAPRDTVAWFYLAENFEPFTGLVCAGPQS